MFIPILGKKELNEILEQLCSLFSHKNRILPVVAAILSSYRDLSLDPGMVFCGEIGLTGEIRTVSHVDKRVSEAIRLGFTKCIIPKGNKLKSQDSDKIVSISSIQELNELLLK
jgi:DNA repair protein RadA/Sms